MSAQPEFWDSEEKLLKELLFRKEATRDLTKFCKLLSDIEPARHHKVLIKALEDITYKRNNRLMVFMPPGQDRKSTRLNSSHT